MAISEAERADLYTGLSDVLGPRNAEIFMRAVPLHDLDEVATKRDIAELRAEFKSDLAREIGALRKSMTNWMLTILVAVIGAMASIGFLG